MKIARVNRPSLRLFLFSVLLLFPVLVLAATVPQVVPEATCPSCEDLNPCTVDSCDTSTGTCRHDPLNCDDANPCTIDACQMIYPGAGGCTHSNLADGSPCDDGSSCTAGDVCTAVPGEASQCQGQLQPAGTTCDDGNSCTTSDTCDEAGQCVGNSLTAGTPCDDRSLCTSQDVCFVSPAGAVLCQGDSKDCSDGDLCTQDLCDPATGACSHPPVNCDDGNTCTADSCDPSTGTCIRTNVSVSCDDGNPCTISGCYGGNCIIVAGPPAMCDDNIACTHDECRLDLGGCVHTPDDSRCPAPGECYNFACDPTYSGGYPPAPRGCRPVAHNNSCTSQPPCLGAMCYGFDCERFYHDGWPCDDHDVCTRLDQCFGALCRGRPICDDYSVCTTDTCDPDTLTCTYTPNNNSCRDDNNCTYPDQCSNGVCQSGPLLNCDDGNPCTRDECTTWGTCSYFDACASDNNACTLDSCDSETGACSYTPVEGSCWNGDFCTRRGVCSNGTCQTGSVECYPGCCRSDYDACTVDMCDPAVGCVHRMAQQTCGLGICQRTMDLCVGRVPQPCVPGTPAEEVCNGLDDDCDGLVDEVGIRAECILNPSTLNLDSKGDMVSMTCKLFDVCDPDNPVSIPGETVNQVYVSRLDSADSSADDVRLPDPSTLPCPDPVLGMNYERGISENMEARDVSNANVTFKFNGPGDGDCSTLEGDRQDIGARLSSIPDNTSATLCIVGKTGEKNFEACMLMLVRNKGLR